ncbi:MULTISPECIES: hypothetical protein [Acidobacterium]|uniref:Putative membrane protein n=1 Tax=Acidobacterium capsulatum (strain ATCC 51196 / DSM 11244 / BCRC 80197 / JCM 7670 / NBRC 15755 / NCIMB 13165 / 161) TaxID=240015 RepID=C1F919_ACIC5|nr:MULTISPECIES: hypothetical protein [Acidobacterium]ACO32356.1 putative membrane protein [Acidobacterium capsulatum ATCC 51196]HCT62142.1 hypothetical protein [Acidobacterium sp.]
MSHLPAQRLRKFRFNFPQRVAALLLLFFLGQGFWISTHTPLTPRARQFAACGASLWGVAPQPASATPCAPVYDGTLGYRLAGLPVALDQLATGRASAALAAASTGVTSLAFFIRLPFMLAGLALGGCLWWVTRRLYGNPGGYIALGFYCFTPPLLAASATPNNEILAAFGLFASLYTAIGVAHAMQGPRRKWRKRILLLTVTLGFTAAAHLVAFLVAIIPGTLLLIWLAEKQRKYLPGLVFTWTAGALLLLWAETGFRSSVFAAVFTHAFAHVGFSLRPLPEALSSGQWLPQLLSLTAAFAIALILYGIFPRSRYFGNTVPLVLLLLLALLRLPAMEGSPWLWALPFLLTFLGGVWADALESRLRKPFFVLSATLLAAQAVLSLGSLSVLIAKWLP